MKAFKVVLTLLAVQALTAPTAALAFENGGYLVTRWNGGATTEVTFAEYNDLYRHLVGITFPVSGEDGVRMAMVPEYDVRQSPRDYLRNKYRGTEYAFVYVPRTVYDYLYYIFYTTQNPPEKMPVAAVGAPDASMYLAWIMRSEQAGLDRYFLEQILAEDVINRHARFNVWAMQWLLKDSAVVEKLKNEGPGSVVRFDTGHLVRIVKELTRLNRKLPDKVSADRLNDILAIVVAEEDSWWKERVTFLTRYVTDGPDGLNYPTRRGATGALTSETFSLSFGPGIFAAAFGNDQNACTYAHLEKARTFIYPIDLARYRRREGLEGLFFIPPFPAILQQHADMNELWHPRTRLFVRQNGTVSMAGGVNTYGLEYAGRAWDGDWKKVGFLLYDGGRAQQDLAIIQLSDRLNRSIRGDGIVIVR